MRKSKSNKYPNTPLGEQKRAYGEGVSVFDVIRKHFFREDAHERPKEQSNA